MRGFGFPIYWAAGPYYLFGRDARIKSCDSSWGAKTFLEATLFDGVILGGQWTYDTEYNGRIQGYLGFSFPLGPNTIRRGGAKWQEWYSPACQTEAEKQRLLTGPIRRDEIIPVCVVDDRPLPLSILPSISDPPPPCFFVNNSLAVDGDGTFENPFNNLASAEAASSEGDCIYVFFGTGATTPGYDTGFVLKDRQVFYGSGFDFIVDGVNILPAQTPGNSPTISGVPGFALTLANNNDVNGFVFDGVPGITGTSIVGGRVANSVFSNFPISVMTILDIATSTGDFLFTNNQFLELDVAIDVEDFSSGAIIFRDNLFSSSSISQDYFRVDLRDGGTFIFENNVMNIQEVLGGGDVDLIEVDNMNTISATNNVVVRNNDITMLSTTPGVTPLVFESFDFGILGALKMVVENNTFNTNSDLPYMVFFLLAQPTLLSLQMTDNIMFNTVTPPSIGGITISSLGADVCTNIDRNFMTNTEIILGQLGPGFFEAAPGSAAAMSAGNSGAPVLTAGSVNFNANLPVPPCL